MKDPFPIPPPEWLVSAVKPYADALNLPTLPLHAHEIFIAFFFYTAVGSIVSPIASSWICPSIYKKLNTRTRLNWDVHVVSFIQAILISVMSLYVIFYDDERKEMRHGDQYDGRVWEYTGLSGLCQSFALGYFLWDFIMCSWHVDIFGLGMLAHAVSALSVFALGYRPFIYFYAPVFLLYELSSPFLNIHWFCDKIDMTGSTLQAVNGIFLVGSFFGARLVYGNINSVYVFSDVYRAIFTGQSETMKQLSSSPSNYTAQDLLAIAGDEQGQRLAFASGSQVPLWLGLVYLASNLTLNSLNIFWFSKMIETIRKRFDPPFGTKGVEDAQEKVAHAVENATNGEEKASIQRVTLADGSKSVEMSGQRTVRTRRKA